MAHSPERYHSLDFLRGFAMFLGILLHGILSFTDPQVPFWPAHDDKQSKACFLFVFVVHDFRMQTFFFLAGFFGCLLYQRYGLGGMLKHRFLRIAVPFGLALVLVVPTLLALWLAGDPKALNFAGHEPDRSRSIGDHFLSGDFVRYILPFHLWFLYFLILFFAAMIPLAILGDRLRPTRLGQAGDRLFRALASMPGKAFVLAALTTALLWPMKFWGAADTPEGWSLNFALLGYYFFFFLAGWQLWRHRELLHAFTRRWAASLLAANLLVMPGLLVLMMPVFDALEKKTPLPGDEFKPAICYVAALYTWLMVGGLMGAFQYFFDGERKWVRYLADASYWCYLWHLTPIIALQMLLAHAPLPGPVKYAIIIGGSLAILLVTYEWCVRYTFIGAILNGRKYRHPRPASTPVNREPPVVLTERET